ncbi:MAG TPA: hypothetical protein VGG39_13035 [Polyangiaceae bacterium]|jgi:hypothetical protein
MVTRVHAELLALAGDTRSPRPSDRGTVRARDVNWGDRTRLQGRKSQTLAWVSLSTSSSIVVYAHANIRSGKSLVYVSIEWGNGGASVTGDYRVIKRLRVPLVASMVKLSGRLAASDGSPANASDAADVSAFVAEGTDGETLRNTEWTSQIGSAGIVAKGSQRLMRIEGYNAGAATFVHVFDGPPELGSEPTILIPAPAGRRFRARRFDSQGFVDSVQWGASSTPLTYTPNNAATLRVDAELLL